ncbi:protease I [Methanohalophilus levihalophilus]|uniref:DJ-1/PfpI family protein n=1 Tax=Methanohalophilus levihalophilus TaxID=1431282 RepID=UPI001AEAE666|nr:DJ-1/PfpI family protein [Methanohalophilus levihalophilus]MBP2029254.1 protease I [Methanohalophilus levihalophilus]
MADSKKILMVIAQENFRDEEYLDPRKVFEKNGYDVTVASNSTETARGAKGEKVKPDIAIADANADDYDSVVIVGGGGSVKFLWDNVKLRSLAKDAEKSGKVVAAICLSPVVLAKAGLLKGKKSTVFAEKTAIKALKKNGAKYEDTDVLREGKIVTGRDPKAAKKFGETVVEALKG